MKTLFKLQIFKSLWIPKPSCRLFHKQPGLLAAELFSHEESIRKGEQQVPEYFNFASDVLDKWSQMEKDGKRSSNPAFWWINGRGNEVKWSFEELGFLSRKVANVLTETCDLQKGDRVMLILPRIPEWWLVNVACMRTGIVLVLGTSQLTAKDILYRLQASKAKCIITNDTVASAVDAVASDCQFLKTKLIVSEGRRDEWLNFNELYKVQPADHICVKTKLQDPMVIYFTSGTTGSPKMAEHSQGSLGFKSVISERSWLDLTPTDVIWCITDTGWIISSIGSVIDSWVFGSCVFVHHLPQVESTAILSTLSRFPITTLFGAPTLFRMLLQHDLTRIGGLSKLTFLAKFQGGEAKWNKPIENVLMNPFGSAQIPCYKFMSLKHCVSGGEPLNPEVIEQWKRKTGLNIYEIYGQTETAIICAVVKGMKIKPGSMGKPAPFYDVQIIDENANVLPPGQDGEIAIRIKPKRPLGLFSKYIDNPEKNAASERGNFFVTGDRGIMDEDGYFWFLGRSDDIINSSGYRIGPFEVESALLEHPAVAESAAVSSPDPLRGEVVKAFVVLSPAFSSCDQEKLTLELQEHVKKVTAPYKYPRKMEFVQQLPKTITGKIKRNELRNKEWGRM